MTEELDLRNLGRICNEILILETLRPGRKHGYQIALEIEERSGGFFALNYGTLYPILHSLEKGGLIEGHWTKDTGRRRKEYALTADGSARLERRAEEWRTLFRELAGFLEPATEEVAPDE